MTDTPNTPVAGSGEDRPAAQSSSLGLAGGMARAFIHSPLTPLLFFAMLAMGIMGLVLTPRQEDPQISVPMIDIFLAYPGVSADQVASLAVDPLERKLSEIPGIKHVYSATQRGEAVITVQFKVGEELGPSVVKIHDKIQSNLDLMPPGVQPPLVKPKGIDDVPVVTLTLWSEEVDDAGLRNLANEVLQNLKQIPDTGNSFVVGGRSEQVRVEVLPERLSTIGLSLGEIAQVITSANRAGHAGTTEAGGLIFNVYAGEFLAGARDIGNLVITSREGQPVLLRDIARVEAGPQEYEQLVNYFTGAAYTGEAPADGVPAVTLAIAKKIGSNGVTVANAILERTDALKGRLIPDNVNVAVTRNYGKTANDKVNDLLKKLFIATGAVTVLVFVALGWRPAIVVTAVIPVVLLMTVFGAWLLEYTIDRVSLFALIFAIGILVDDAIVVIENIYRRWLQQGQTDTAVAVDAVREVGNPTILATFTVVAALLPMGFVTGLMGPYMQPIPALGSVAMIVSLLASFIFVPWLAMLLRPTLKTLQRAAKSEHATERALGVLYGITLVPLIRFRILGWAFLLGLIAAFFASVYLFVTTDVTVKMLPLDNKPEFSVVVDMPEGTALGSTANVTRRIAEELSGIPEVTAIQTYAGTAKPFDFNGLVRHYYLRQSPWHGEVQVQLLDKKERTRKSHEIAVEARERLATIRAESGASLTIVEMPPGPPVLQAVVAEIYGPDAETRRQVTEEMTEIFNSVDGLADVDNFLTAEWSSWRFVVDTNKVMRLGISPATVVDTLDMAMGGYKLGDIKRGQFLEPTFIVLQVPLAVRAQIGRLGELPVPTASGDTVPLAELGRFTLTPEDETIFHKDLRPVQFVVGDAVGRLGAPIYPILEVEKRLQEYTTPDGVQISGSFFGPPAETGQSAFEWAGEWTVTYETFRDMGIAFAVALIAIYILVVWEFGNFLLPAIIMAPIPLTLLGIVPGHYLLDAEFTATSMIGFIALAGIIVRNSILLVDFSIGEVRRGVDVEHAVVEACKTRTRPIVITALALVAGSSVILTDPIFQGMAVSLLFGVLVSTLLTLIVIPLGCVSAGRSLTRAAMADH